MDIYFIDTGYIIALEASGGQHRKKLTITGQQNSRSSQKLPAGFV